MAGNGRMPAVGRREIVVKGKHLIIILFLLGAVLVSACGRTVPGSTSADGLPDLHGHHIVVYSAMRDEVGRAALELFREKTGCTYDYIYLPTQAMLGRVRREKDRPQADIMMGGATHAQVSAAEHHLTASVVLPGSEVIPESFRSAERRWFGIASTPLAIVVNRERWEQEFAPRGKKMPATYEDLLDPDYRGEVAFADPNAAGTSYTLLAYVRQHSAAPSAFYTSLKANLGESSYNGFEAVQRVASGQCLLGVGFLDDERSLESSGFPIRAIVPEGCAWTLDAVAKVEGAPHPREAEAFLRFCMMEETQEVLNRIAFSAATHPGAVTQADKETMAHYGEMDFRRAAEEQEAILHAWNDISPAE